MTKWLKILLIVSITLITVVAVSFACLKIFGFKGKRVEDLPDSGEEQVIEGSEKSIADCTPNECIYILSGKIKKLSYHATITGQVSALGGFYKQNVEGEKFHQNKKGLYISKSSSSFVKVGKKIYIDEEENVKVLDPKDLSNDTWNDTPTDYTLTAYLKDYGVDFRSLTNYLLNDETILQSELVKVENNNYTFKYKLDTEKATIGYRINMAKMGNLNSVPEFNSCEFTIVINENFEPVSMICDEVYTVEMLGGLKCTSSMTTTFDSINQNIAFPTIAQFE